MMTEESGRIKDRLIGSLNIQIFYNSSYTRALFSPAPLNSHPHARNEGRIHSLELQVNNFFPFILVFKARIFHTQTSYSKHF